MADKPARLVSAADPIVLLDPPQYVSRGGGKLAAALARFVVQVGGARCLDAGSSTGGFTDCLLQCGAAHVLAVDVGRGQMHEQLRRDPRVTLLEQTHVRDLTETDIQRAAAEVPGKHVGPPFDVVVADLSFISLTAVVGTLAGPMARHGADLVLLVKPQFEVGRLQASRGRGVVRDPELRRAALGRVACAVAGTGASIIGAMASPVVGPAGNVEYLLHATAHTAGGATPGSAPAPLDAKLDTAVQAKLDAAVQAGGSEG